MSIKQSKTVRILSVFVAGVIIGGGVMTMQNYITFEDNVDIRVEDSGSVCNNAWYSMVFNGGCRATGHGDGLDGECQAYANKVKSDCESQTSW